MNQTYSLAPSAKRDLEGIAAFYQKKADLMVAEGVIRGLLEAFRLLSETPGTIGQERDELRPGIRSFPLPPHVIFFRYRNRDVEVVRILHERRDLEGFW